MNDEVVVSYVMIELKPIQQDEIEDALAESVTGDTCL